MNGSKAKAIRKAIGFDVHAPREYDVPANHLRGGKAVTGTIKSTGARHWYQQAKRHGGVLRAA